jgi:pimeloyl-ACP methyl ester carboxylesterase
MQEKLLNTKYPFLCVQTFGKQNNPAIILIAGAAGQGILWPTEFCLKLSQEGHFVIRYDNRDTGKSSGIDFETSPYSLQNMAEDVISILDQLSIKQAHIVGMSMGGYIAQILAYYYPSRILSICLFMTTINSSALRGMRKLCNLPGQDPSAVEAIAKIYQVPRSEAEDKVRALVEVWRIFNGNKCPFPYEEMYELASLSYQRATTKNAVRNHRMAVLNSQADRRFCLENMPFPVLIMHGENDPIIKIEHAYYTNQHVIGSKLYVIKNLGHLFSSHFTEQISDIVLGFIHFH